MASLVNNQPYSGAGTVANPQSVFALSVRDYNHITYASTKNQLCNKTLTAGQTVFNAADSTSCSTPFDAKNIAVVPGSIDQGFMLLGDGTVRDAYLKRGNVATTVQKLVNANPCALALRTNGQAVLLNKANVSYGKPTDMPSQGFDANCYGMSALLNNRVFRDISAISPFGPPFDHGPLDITAILADGTMRRFSYSMETWNETQIYTPTVQGIFPIHAGAFIGNANAVLVMNDGSMRYLQPVTVSGDDTPCVFPSTMNNAVKIEVVEVIEPLNAIVIPTLWDQWLNHVAKRYVYAQKNDGSLWRWRLPTPYAPLGNDTCDPELTQLSANVADFVVNAYGVYTIEKSVTNDFANTKASTIVGMFVTQDN
jgi:hypothetical protein